MRYYNQELSEMRLVEKLNMFALTSIKFKRPSTVEASIYASGYKTSYMKVSLFGVFGYSICLSALNLNFSEKTIKIMRGNHSIASVPNKVSRFVPNYIKIEAT